MSVKLDLSPWGITRPSIVRNPVPAVLYEKALKHDAAAVSSAGALITSSAAKTGRSPKDKR
ncbi:MAG: phosphoenolpyruvate carboxykinase (ATP), partial [Thermoguttaceae bacterium]|nr:phosphoenolpyruvate carboxykinase (ATP) [Thermoguttaceae bacterium]